MKIKEVYYRLKGQDDFVTRNHSHDEIEFIHVLVGSGTVLKDDKSYLLQSRFLYIIDARKPHIVNPVNVDEYVRNKFVINANDFFELCAMLGIDDAVEKVLHLPPIPVGGDKEFERLFQKIEALCKTGKKDDMGFAVGYVLQLIHKACNAAQIADEQPETVTVIDEVLNVIADKNGETSLSEISELLHLNKYYLCHKFKEETGITLTDYLAEKRFEKCKLYLTETGYSAEKIAALCGFASTSSLTRFFKKKSGMCPKEYRKLYADTR